MPCPVPCMLSFGEKLSAVDCYADLFIFPGAHFLMNFDMRSHAPFHGEVFINVGFALFDAQGNPLGGRTYGMEEDQASRIEPLARGFPPEHHDTIAWAFPPELLPRTERIAICFRPKGAAPDWEKLERLAKAPISIFEASR